MRAWLTLIPKGGVTDSGLPKVRPICLLPKMGKIFERILVGRLRTWMRENPDASLSEDQYGFCPGKSTCDALLRLRRTVERETGVGGYVVAVSLDIHNAFNTLPWPKIRKALRTKGFPLYLRKMIDHYLYQRSVEYPTRQGTTVTRPVRAGVP